MTTDRRIDATLAQQATEILTRSPKFRVFFLGDTALQVIAEDALPSPHLSQTLQALAQNLRKLECVSAAICAFDSITLILPPNFDPLLAIRQVQIAMTQEVQCATQSDRRTHHITFSRAKLAAEFRSDLAALAIHAQYSQQQWLMHFCATCFTVAMIGFKPGFPYLLGLPESLAMPRLTTPRISVAKGSIAIGGAFAGIYPARSAGGWHVIGITDAILFDIHRTEPCLLAAGDTVRFTLQEA